MNRRGPSPGRKRAHERVARRLPRHKQAHDPFEGRRVDSCTDALQEVCYPRVDGVTADFYGMLSDDVAAGKIPVRNGEDPRACVTRGGGSRGR